MRKTPRGYIKVLEERQKESRVHFKHQSTGLALAEILEDQKHKSLYMKLAKKYAAEELIKLARDVASRRSVKNKGAYFMKLLTDEKKRR
ncbi:MAG: hypothetical protein UY26_C0003G0319 [Candidatus Jorgensenbacteria bacterium GW2011_GWA1_48_13]|uniref:Uncharacterized protein n=1 Tax=Candidatus Jorgensenbacteria bacterium GW2011_GWB1_50_10 TaxID=1618665 RepID=A0A0G1W7V9_9BACT|nr:MAG: hypothetical protein UY26_C0003G0319 [Candidatus Jorgensenbacteria bacterium GW2011_GWA1_48_13]KKW14793.1 MAG: hypothetical protein UY55_C0003G0009 [Candidatus Jorgensenbacteria bacterium GW2011_GWB1_50_10]